MDPTTLIETALATGVAKGLGDTASTAVADAYQRLKALLSQVFGGRPEAALVLTQHAADPGTWKAPLAKLLGDSDAYRDEQVIAAAQRVLELTDPGGAQSGKYRVRAAGSNIGNIGDHAKQHNVFGIPPAGH